MSWVWPLKTNDKILPDEKGSFGSVRKFDTHTGIDLYCEIGTLVLAVEAGTVISIENFTGEKAGFPWWNDTQAILISGESGVVVYGECESKVKIGDNILAGQEIGIINTPVLKSYKGRPTVMLHLELMKHGELVTTLWKEKRPEGLLDPTPYLLNISDDKIFFDIELYDGLKYRMFDDSIKLDSFIESAVIIIKFNNKYLMLERSSEDKSFSGHSFPGGKKEGLESITATAVRELFEETSLKVDECNLVKFKNVFLTKSPKSGMKYIMHIYYFDWNSTFTNPNLFIKSFPDRESISYIWCAADDEINVAGNVTQRLLNLLKYKNKIGESNEYV